jgi:hypothetical protein
MSTTIGDSIMGATVKDGNATQSGRARKQTVKPRTEVLRTAVEAVTSVVAAVAKVPKMQVFRTPARVIAEEKAQKQAEREEVQAAMQGDDGIVEAIRQNILALREYYSYSREDRETSVVKGAIASIKKTLADIGNYPDGTDGSNRDFRTPARLAQMSALVRVWPEGFTHTDRSIGRVCRELLDLGFISQVDRPKGTRIAGRNYVLAKEYGEQPEAVSAFRELSKMWTNYLSRQRQEFEASMEQAMKVVGSHPRVNQDMAREGKEGRGIWDVADLSLEDRATGRPKLLAGGKAVFEAKDGGISILMGLGPLRIVAEGVAGVSIPYTQMGTNKLELGYFEEDRELFDKKRRLHSLVNRALQAWREGTSLREKRAIDNSAKRSLADQTAENYRNLATLSVEDFNGSNKPGTLACTSWHGRFNIGRPPKMRTVYDPHFILERREDGEVRVSQYSPDHEFFFRRYTNFQPLDKCGQLKALVNEALGIKKQRHEAAEVVDQQTETVGATE